MAIETFEIEGVVHSQANDVLTAAGDGTALRLGGGGLVVVQIAGSATAIAATVMRSPDGADDNYSPAGDQLIGNPATGMSVRRYDEPSRGFWKVRVDSVTGSAKVHLSGEQA